MTTFDVAVIGGGVVGAAIARELSRYQLSVALVEAGDDVGAGTSKANTAILHTGFDAPPGSLEAKLVARGHALLGRYADEANIAVERTGAILVAWSDEQRASLPFLREKAFRNGVTDLKPLTTDELYAREPQLGAGALGGLLIPGESIICPYTPPLAFAYEAVQNGATLLTRHPVIGARDKQGVHALAIAGDRSVHARWVVNAAGLGSDEIDALFGHRRFRVQPRRGELIVFDKLARPLLKHILLPVPTKTTKGVLVSPTVFGNVILGPTAEDLDDKTQSGTTEAGLQGLWQKGRAILPALMQEEVTATYAGLRAATEHGDYQIHVDAKQRYLCVGGIRSTGLTASLAIGEFVVHLLAEAQVRFREKPDFRRVRMPSLGQATTRPHAQAEAIARDREYGRIVCHCERVSAGEIRDAAQATIPARSLDGLRRRTRCLQGRCQGFFCLASVVTLLARESSRTPAELLALDEEPTPK
jgi:glycerol-3-phosphate dehydrogenase